MRWTSTIAIPISDPSTGANNTPIMMATISALFNWRVKYFSVSEEYRCFFSMSVL